MDEERDKAPGYYKIIKVPMYYELVDKKLENGQYSSPEEFAADMRLVYANAMLYNPKMHGVHAIAQKTSETFEKRVLPVLAQWEALKSSANQ